jgi:hypothetical protein
MQQHTWIRSSLLQSSGASTSAAPTAITTMPHVAVFRFLHTKLTLRSQNNINHLQEIEYEQKQYSNLSYTRSDIGPKPYGPGNYCTLSRPLPLLFICLVPNAFIGVPVYAKSTDLVPALIMWFFDSRSFVSGTGNGPGPVPDAANYYWVDERTVPSYITSQSMLMQSTVSAIHPSLNVTHQIPCSGDEFHLRSSSCIFLYVSLSYVIDMQPTSFSFNIVKFWPRFRPKVTTTTSQIQLHKASSTTLTLARTCPVRFPDLFNLL